MQSSMDSYSSVNMVITDAQKRGWGCRGPPGVCLGCPPTGETGCCRQREELNLKAQARAKKHSWLKLPVCLEIVKY